VVEVNINELAQNYTELADEELLRMHTSGQLTESAFNVLEKELTQRGIPIPQRVAESEIAQGRYLSLRALWEGKASLASAWGLWIALNIVASSVVNLIIEDLESPVVDFALAIIALPFGAFVLISIWRCAWNTGWKGWGYISRTFVAAIVIGLLLFEWITAAL
jgi:hypothetical protein